MIKIAYVIDTIESPTAGTEKQLLLLIKHLNRSRFEPHLCVLRSSKWLREEFSECPVFEVGVNSFKRPRSYVGILKFAIFLKNERFNIVQPFFRDSSIVGIIAANLARVKTVVGTRRNQCYSPPVRTAVSDAFRTALAAFARYRPSRPPESV